MNINKYLEDAFPTIFKVTPGGMLRVLETDVYLNIYAPPDIKAYKVLGITQKQVCKYVHVAKHIPQLDEIARVLDLDVMQNPNTELYGFTLPIPKE